MPTTERTWDRRVEKWHSHVTSAEAFREVLDRLIQLSSPKPSDACVDLGAGTGFATEQGSGAGLGLAIGDSIVRSTGGRWHIGDSPLGGALMMVTWKAESHTAPARRPSDNDRRAWSICGGMIGASRRCRRPS